MSWLFAGDSILCGMGAHLVTALGSSVPGDIQCRIGATTGFWLEPIGPLLTEKRPSALIYVLGTNDDGELRPDAYAAQILALVSSGRRRGIPVIWIGPFGQGDWRARGEIIHRVVAANGGTYIDGAVLAAGLARASDGIHFTDYEALAARLAARLRGGSDRSAHLDTLGAILLGAALTGLVVLLTR